MRISALADTTGVSVATVKFYLREGLLPPGTPLSRTQADYTDEHVRRIRLIRALTGPGQLSLAATARALAAIDGSPLDVMREAQLALYPDDASAPDRPDGPSPAVVLLEQLDWLVDPDHPAVAALDHALTGLDEAEVAAAGQLERYAAAMHEVAETDIDAVPVDPAQAVREVVLGTVLLDPVLQALRRVAQQDVARRRMTRQDRDTAGPAPVRGKLDT